jgi:hypothetical protein
MSFKWKFTGTQELMHLLLNFDKKFRNKHLRKAGNEASKIAAKSLKAHAPKKNRAWGTGFWKRSIGRKVLVYRGTLLVYIVGPRSKVIGVAPGLKWRFWRDKQGRIRKAPVARFKNAGAAKAMTFRKRRPVNYSHLLERRHHPIQRSLQASRPAELRALTAVLAAAVKNPRS